MNTKKIENLFKKKIIQEIQKNTKTQKTHTNQHKKSQKQKRKKYINPKNYFF